MLQKLPENAIVVLQKDSGGNGYSPCSGVEAARYEAESAWAGEVLSPDEDDYATRGVVCVVLWPVN